MSACSESLTVQQMALVYYKGFHNTVCNDDCVSEFSQISKEVDDRGSNVVITNTLA